jgi:hypothetical protein
MPTVQKDEVNDRDGHCIGGRSSRVDRVLRRRVVDEEMSKVVIGGLVGVMASGMLFTVMLLGYKVAEIKFRRADQ